MFVSIELVMAVEAITKKYLSIEHFVPEFCSFSSKILKFNCVFVGFNDGMRIL